jgi:hypothetical protein
MQPDRCDNQSGLTPLGISQDHLAVSGWPHDPTVETPAKTRQAKLVMVRFLVPISPHWHA